MKTFEEKWTAWVDGQLTGEELEEFKAALPDLATAELEREDSLKLGNLLREKIGVRAMTNEEFFHHQLRTAIEQDARETAPLARPETKVRETWWSIGRLAWTGAASLAVFAVLSFFVLRDSNVGGQSTYLTQIINARVDPAVSPNATISIFETKEDRVTVVWVDGLQSLPSEYAAK
ncbi:MAG: hypothetical protein ABIR71_06805 [Chthoniobacterales bacterium]